MRGGISGNLSCAGREIRAGGKLEITEVAGIEGLEFSIKSVSHRLDSKGYFLDVEFEG
ncbi:MAG: hypothetical protein ACTTJS_04190 [Wolinella sp.]